MEESSAASATGMVTASFTTTSLPMVVATATPKRKGATKFDKADIESAIRGDIARELIAVATTLALSWKPFRKPKTKADEINIAREMFTTNTNSYNSELRLAYSQEIELAKNPEH